MKERWSVIQEKGRTVPLRADHPPCHFQSGALRRDHGVHTDPLLNQDTAAVGPAIPRSVGRPLSGTNAALRGKSQRISNGIPYDNIRKIKIQSPRSVFFNKNVPISFRVPLRKGCPCSPPPQGAENMKRNWEIKIGPAQQCGTIRWRKNLPAVGSTARNTRGSKAARDHRAAFLYTAGPRERGPEFTDPMSPADAS